MKLKGEIQILAIVCCDMTTENFQPIPVKSKEDNSFLFGIRCLVDLQLKTISKFLHLEIPNLSSIRLSSEKREGGGVSRHWGWRITLEEFSTERI